MGRRIECFWMVPVAEVEVSLRRYRSAEGEACPGPYGYHNASAVIGRKPEPLPDTYDRSCADDEVAHDDPRWPVRCGCGYVFGADDPWQVNQRRLYERADSAGERVTLDDMPLGAMWDAWWYPDAFRHSVDGMCIAVKTPGGTWVIDHPDGKGWTRTGTPPRITASPSILFPDDPARYHAFLTDGVLEDC